MPNFQKTELDSTVPRYLWAISQPEEEVASQPQTSRKLK